MGLQTRLSHVDMSGLRPRTLVTLTFILFLSVLAATLATRGAEVLSITYFPTVPQEGQPATIAYTIKNPSTWERTYAYSFYLDGRLAAQGTTTLQPKSLKQYSHTYPAPSVWGATTTGYVKAQDTATGATHDASLRIPPYPPEIWSSFSSFATFSSTLLTSTTTIVFYETVITSQIGLELGLTISITLIGLLVFLELSHPAYGKIGTRLKGMRTRYGILAVSLLTVFAAMVLTRIVLILSGV